MPAASKPEKSIQLPSNHLLSRLIGGVLVLNLIVAGIILSSLYRGKDQGLQHTDILVQSLLGFVGFGKGNG